MVKAAQKVRGKFSDEKYTGPEPVLSDKHTSVEEASVYNWYNYYYSHEDAKTFALTYLKSVKFDKAKLKKLASVRADKLRTVGWLCRSLSQGGSLSPALTKKLWSQIEDILKSTVEPIDEPTESNETVQNETKVVSIHDRVNAKADNLIADIEDKLDLFYREGKSFDAAAWFRKNDVKAQVAQKIAAYYKPLYSEIYDAQQGKDAQLVEAYARWKKSKKFKAYLEFVRDIIAAAEGRAAVAKAVRKPRKKKEKPASAIVAKLQFLAEDAALDIKSIKPAEIVGAQQLWVYNNKYKTLAVYNAMGPSGFSVKGTTVLGFDEKTSIIKTLRKPKEQLKTLQGAGKIALRKFMDGIKSKSKPATGRINKDTVLIRVGK